VYCDTEHAIKTPANINIKHLFTNKSKYNQINKRTNKPAVVAVDRVVVVVGTLNNKQMHIMSINQSINLLKAKKPNGHLHRSKIHDIK